MMLFWIAVTLLAGGALLGFYILIGYPLLLGLARFRTAPPVAKDLSFQGTVSIVLAVYNGAAFLRAKLDCLLGLDYPRELVEILVVSDGSTDQTEDIVRSYADRGVHLIVVPRGGKAAALNAAFERARGKFLFLTDVRQPIERGALRHLIANFADPTVGAVTGEMQLLRGEAGEHADMDLYWRYEVWARSRHSAIDSIFTATGCVYALRRELAGPLPPDTLSDDALLPLRAFFRGYRVVFDPAAVAYDYPAVAGTEFRRRMRNLAGLWQLHARLPELFGARNRMRLHFLPHKFGRLALPWAIVMIVAGTLLLPQPAWRNWLLWNEAMLPLAALADRFVPRGFVLKRLTSPARTFLVMNAAALAAMCVFFVPATKLWLPTRVEAAGRGVEPQMDTDGHR
jgi:cellulose synthase/poly-beta-1,6-N-acetylglucosamine synthase-like glycosyltransferase